jgi:hypothetical protein
MRGKSAGAAKTMHHLRATYLALLALALSTAAGRPAAAEDPWRPFLERDAPKAEPDARDEERTWTLLPPMGEWAPPRGRPSPAPSGWNEPAGPELAVERRDLPPIDPESWAVERSELAPVMTSDGAGPPLELWSGLDLAAVESLMARVELPLRSPALHALWRRLLMSDATAPAGTAPEQFVAMRSETLYRSGLLREMNELLTKIVAGRQNAIATALKVKSELALGNREAGCEAASGGGGRSGELPNLLRRENLVLAGYCAAAIGNAGAAGLAADLAREEGYDEPLALAALEAVALGQKPRLSLPKRLTPVQYRLLQLSGGAEWTAVLERADAPLFAALVYERDADPKLRLAAAEAAVRINVIEPAELAEIYRLPRFLPSELTDPPPGRSDPLLRRALLFQSAEMVRPPPEKARAIRTFLDEARRNGLYLHGLRMLAQAVEDVPKIPEIAWFTETAIESMLAAGKYDNARAWTTFGSSLDRARPDISLQHWLALADIADPDLKAARGSNLTSVEDLALVGRFDGEVLHRLATVLEALDYNVPIALWEMASGTPQPTNGHLPETGVLAELQDASKKREVGRTALLTLHSLGPGGAETAHVIALGDALRALKRASLEHDARRLAFEALFASWPRLAAN